MKTAANSDRAAWRPPCSGRGAPALSGRQPHSTLRFESRGQRSRIGPACASDRRRGSWQVAVPKGEGDSHSDPRSLRTDHLHGRRLRTAAADAGAPVAGRGRRGSQMRSADVPAESRGSAARQASLQPVRRRAGALTNPRLRAFPDLFHEEPPLPLPRLPGAPLAVNTPGNAKPAKAAKNSPTRNLCVLCGLRV